jgi:hypothetical protein
MAMMLSGELTNPFERAICNSVGKARDFCYAIYPYVEIAFEASYAFVR